MTPSVLRTSSRSAPHRTAYDRFLATLDRVLRRAGIRSPSGVTQPIAGPSAPDARAADPVVGRVQTFVDAHLATNLTVDDLADAVDLSPSSLERRFRTEMDTTPWRYVLARRIDAAKHLLETTDRSLAAIAFDTGFYDQPHFTRTFKRLEGQPPGAYREDAKND
jgi:transcriptional regulator GlxA family with amidase domain